MEERTSSRPTSHDIAYIYHVIGTLEWNHIIYGMESLKNQDIHWKAFILYNGGDFPDEDILALVPMDKFDEAIVYPYNPNIPKSSVADWDNQMKFIDGFGRYFVHKADFYLANGVCEEFERIKETPPWICMFHKFDMKENATIETYRLYASRLWEDNMEDSDTGDYWGEHIGKLAIPFKQIPGKMDGTMHGYTDDTRELYRPDINEVNAKWGGTKSFDKLILDTGLVTSDKLFALHMFHFTPDRKDPVKLTRGEMF